MSSPGPAQRSAADDVVVTSPEPTPVPPHATHPATLGAVVGALGIVFGDIATSPLYAMQECIGGPHGVDASAANVTGVVSLIIWSLLFVVTFKYVFILMRADNRGEGGIMALLGLVPRRLRERRGRLSFVTIIVLVGAAFLFGDGMITPAISVLSALEGLKHIDPRLDGAVVPGTVVVLIALFAIQRRGSGRLASIFGPVMLLWLAVLFVLGLVQLVQTPQILAAFSLPGLTFLAHGGLTGIRVVGGVVLAVTRCPRSS